MTKMRASAKQNDATLAAFHERQGEYDEAAAILEETADQAAMNPQAQPQGSDRRIAITR